ncbi:pentatricopeptide repeat-containing protein At1g76280 isoform X2 [Cryptomeria japonica]|uniref:pentatricopeptide repeat-containing protein At1g76280 isoform X2 n=1 Tax=Cryptomeria japonica TaxID=3369 RepID=UPI0025AC8610|nr:pentatricopeptide repeat-containing protein At1g76280 isoform X2 [Cryptomeria japonica]
MVSLQHSYIHHVHLIHQKFCLFTLPFLWSRAQKPYAGSKVSVDEVILFKQSLQVRIHEALRLGNTKMTINLLCHLGSMEDSLTSEDCMFLLESCWRFPDPEYALELWRLMDEKRLEIKRSGYLCILRALTKGGYLDEALYLLKSLGESSCGKAGLYMCDIFLNGCSEYRSLVHAKSCLELIENRCIGKSETTYIELMKLAVHGQNISALKQVWEDYNKFFLPSILSYQKYIWSLCRMRASAEANEALQRMILVVFKASSLQLSLDGWFHALKVRIPVPSKDFDESETEAVSKNYGTRGLQEADCLHGSQMDVLSVHTCKFRPPVTSSDLDILNKCQNHTINLGHQLLHDSVNENKLQSSLLKANKKHVAQASNDTNSFFHGDIMETFIENSEISSNRKLYSEEPSPMLSGMTEHFNRGGRYKLEATDLYLLRESFNNVICLAAFNRNYELAKRLFFQMHRLGLEPLQATYNAYLKAVIVVRGVIHGMEVVSAMKSKNVKPNNITYAALAVGYSKIQQLDWAEAMLEQMDEKQPQHIYPFNRLLAACCKANEPERAMRVIARMRLVNVKPNLSTYEMMFFLFGNVNSPYERGDQMSQEAVSKRIATIEMDMARNGVEHSRKSVTNLLTAFAAEGMIRELVRYLHDLEDRFNGSDAPLLGSDIYNVVLHALVDAKEWELAIGIFGRMKSFGIKPDVKTYTIMVDCYSISGDFNSARELVNTMLQRGLKHHARTHTSIMKIFLANGAFEKVLDFLKEMKEDGILSDVIVYNTIIRQASEKVRFDVIELVVEHMHRQKIKPDPETCWQVFSSYHDHGFFDTAVEALQVLSVRMVSENETVQRKMKSIYEKLILDESPSTDEFLVEIFKDSREYLSASLFNMRLCAFTGVSNSWVPEESPWAIRLRSQYNQSPFVEQ